MARLETELGRDGSAAATGHRRSSRGPTVAGGGRSPSRADGPSRDEGEPEGSPRRRRGASADLGPPGERARLAALIPHNAYCGYCDKLVPEAEWAETPARDGFDVYHKPDGYRARAGILGGPATVLFWRTGSAAEPPAASR